MCHEPKDGVVTECAQVTTPASRQTGQQKSPRLGRRDKKRPRKAQQQMFDLMHRKQFVPQWGEGSVRGDQDAGQTGKKKGLLPDRNPPGKTRNSAYAAQVKPCRDSDKEQRHQRNRVAERIK